MPNAEPTLLESLNDLEISLEQARKKIPDRTLSWIDEEKVDVSSRITTLNVEGAPVLSDDQRKKEALIRNKITQMSTTIADAVKHHANMSQTYSKGIDQLVAECDKHQGKLTQALTDDHSAIQALSEAKQEIISLKESLKDYDTDTMILKYEAAEKKLIDTAQTALTACQDQFWKKEDHPYLKDYQATSTFIKNIQQELDYVTKKTEPKDRKTNPRIIALKNILVHFTTLNEKYTQTIHAIVKNNPQEPNQSELDAARKTFMDGVNQGQEIISNNAPQLAKAGFFGKIKAFLQEVFRDRNQSEQKDDLSFMKGVGGSKTSAVVKDQYTQLQQQMKTEMTAHRPPSDPLNANSGTPKDPEPPSTATKKTP